MYVMLWYRSCILDGQTGSGKTFTLTGGPEKYSDRGIIPRAISKIFNEFRTRTDVSCKAYVSYLEIYNEQGFDLLDPSHDSKCLEDLPKVTMLEDAFGNYHLKNLSMHAADNEETALNLLFTGDTNRAISETAMNLASSRSHCIFSIAMELRDVGADKVKRCKLHLVDLAGSERVGKTNSTGSVLTEAKHINQSLFFLEMVIVALYEKATAQRKHIPYRNSMMTSVLRDSLGGNCKTIMIATINPEASHTDESLSTCRFAQRVSMIKNKATINEDVDPSIIIKRLKTEVLTLREEVAYLKGTAGEGDDLTPKQIEELKEQIRVFCNDPDPRSLLNIGTLSLTKLKESFGIFKNFVNEGGAVGRGGDKGGGTGGGSDEYTGQIDDLKACLLQRDNEIAILVNMVKKSKQQQGSQGGYGGGYSVNANNAISAGNQFVSDGGQLSSRSVGNEAKTLRSKSNGSVGMGMDDDIPFNSGGGVGRDGGGAPTSAPAPGGSDGRGVGSGVGGSGSDGNKKKYAEPVVMQVKDTREKIIERHLFGIPPPDNRGMLEEGQETFAYFATKSPLSQSIDENKRILKAKMEEAKFVGERANRSRDAIHFLKSSIEKLRREKLDVNDIYESKDGSGGAGDGDMDDDATSELNKEEESYRRAIEQEKTVFKESFEKLRTLRPEIEHVRSFLEKCRGKLQAQFDQWYNNVLSREDILYNSNNNPKHSNYNSSTFASSADNSGSAGVAVANRESLGKSMDSFPSITSHRSGSSRDSSMRASGSVSGGSGATPAPMSSSSLSSEVNEDIAAFNLAKEQMLKRRAEEMKKKQMG